MFTMITKGRYVKTLYEGPGFETALFEDVDNAKIVITLKKNDLYYDLVKSGNWLMVKFIATAKSKITKSGLIIFETGINLDKARELNEEESETLFKVKESVDKDYEKKIQKDSEIKREIIEKFSINEEVKTNEKL